MKKILFLFLFVWAGTVTAAADDYPYLAFQQADGTVRTMSVTSLTLTFANGVLTATNGDGSLAFALGDLSKMYFTQTPTWVPTPKPIPSEGAGETVEVFTPAGLSLGQYGSLDAAREQLPVGIYLVRRGDEILKIAKR